MKININKKIKQRLRENMYYKKQDIDKKDSFLYITGNPYATHYYPDRKKK